MRIPTRVVVEAPAKVNLFLAVTGRRDDGYHLIDTVMQAVSLSDLVVVGRTRAPGIRVTCSLPGVPEDTGNLAHSAATRFWEAMGSLPGDGLHIHIDKRIPQEAGLGGGSADAGAVLVGLDRLYGTALGPERLCALALPLGADIPFALRGGCARVRGVGEVITPTAPLPACHILVAKPAAGVRTREAYGLYDAGGAREAQRPDRMLRALAERDLAAAASAMYNVFETVAPGPETAGIKAAMTSRGALGTALSGSGSAVAGLFAVAGDAALCARELSSGIECFVTSPVGHGVKIVYES